MFHHQTDIDYVEQHYDRILGYHSTDRNVLSKILDIDSELNKAYELKERYIDFNTVEEEHCEDFTLNFDEDFNISDRKNIEILYESLKDLHPANAIDERLWAGMLFGQFWEFVQYRRGSELKSGDRLKVLSSFLFMRGKKRSCFINCLSRLWWTGYLLYDANDSYHYKAVDLIAAKAYSSNIVLISSNNFISNKSLALGVMDSLNDRKKNGDIIERYHFVEANKYLNCLGGVILLDTLTREETKNIVDKRLDKVYKPVNHRTVLN